MAKKLKQIKINFPKHKYRILTESVSDREYIILVDDGGVAASHSDGDKVILTYYQNRISNDTNPDDVWDELNTGDQYTKEFSMDVTLNELVESSLQWLVMFADVDDFERDDSIWTNVFVNA
jgi:hypothetical protein